MTEEYDYEEVGLVAGLEIHQQLDTATKLFCGCPTARRVPEEATRQFTRYLHPTRSELGEIDEAALEESRVEREFEYLAFDTTCLVEEDDEPPHRLDREALSVTLEIAQLLDMEVVDQAHVMRKIVVDGSNTSGFQRTALVATDGRIETGEGPVGIDDLLLEEESAARLGATESGVRYGLDRLGIPLVEIGTGPDIQTPEQAREAAERIGMLLRSTGEVKRGLGTIRQDVNVSIAAGARVELKGVQSLETIDDIVRYEVHRQVRLLELADELQERDAAVGEPEDVSGVFDTTDSAIIASASTVLAVPLYGFDGVVGAEIQPDRRLGTELSDHAERHGAGGIFHTDELPGYGVSEAEVETLREAVGADGVADGGGDADGVEDGSGDADGVADGGRDADGDEDADGVADVGEDADDAVAIVAASQSVAEQAIEAVADRARAAIEGVPEETRDANDDGTSQYLRPLPGAARMYPETDVPPVEPDPTEVETPELLTEKVERYRAEYGLDAGLAEQVAFGERMPVFEETVARGVDPTLAAGTLESTVTELRRDGLPVENLTDEHFLDALALVDAGEIGKEGIEAVLENLAENPDRTAAEAAQAAGLAGVDEAAVRDTVVAVVEQNAEQVEREGMGAFSALMGECMEALRGKADGEEISEVLRDEIQQRAG